MISIKNLTKEYSTTVAVKNLNLQINKEIFVFLGPNGAGKTTSIKMMTGLLTPTCGTVSIDGIDIQKEPVRAKEIYGLVPERPFLYEKLTAVEFVQFMADVYKVPPDEASRRAHQLFDLFKIDDRCNELIENYSQGMKQKVALIGALVHNPKVLFLDEPTVGLDPQSARNFKDLLRGLVDKGTTIFMSTHILEIAERMADRIAIIDNGELKALGTLEELFKKSSDNASTLEDIFLELTGPSDNEKVSNYLQDY